MPEKPRMQVKPGIVWVKNKTGGRTLRTTQGLQEDAEWRLFQENVGIPIRKRRNGLPILGEPRKIDPLEESTVRGRVQAVKYLYFERLKEIKIDSLKKQNPIKLAQLILENLIKEKQIQKLYSLFRKSDAKKINTILLTLTLNYIKGLQAKELQRN